MPLHPRLARLLVAAHALGCSSHAAVAAALLQERDPFLRNDRRGATHVCDSDVVERLVALERFEKHGSSESPVGPLNAGAARFVLRSADQLARDIERALGREPERELALEEALRRALFAAYSDRLASRRETGSRRGVMAGGRGVLLADSSGVVDHELFVCVDLDAGEREALVRQASGVEREWLDPRRVRVESSARFDATRGRVVALRRTLYDDLILDEVETGQLDAEEAGAALARAAAADLEHALPLADEQVVGFLGRVRCLRTWLPELDLPAFTRDELIALLPDMCVGARSFDELKRRDLVEFLRGRLTFEQSRALEREAPERLQVPSGSWIALAYEEGRSPVLAARIQELFGWRETPRIARGRVRVLLHLLAPNYRPQQVTEDLESFWRNVYFDVRKDLKRRYPRHAWPEDPLSAEPERRPRRRTD